MDDMVKVVANSFQEIVVEQISVGNVIQDGKVAPDGLRISVNIFSKDFVDP